MTSSDWMFEWWYGSGTAVSSQSSIRGANVQMTKFGPWKVWCAGGGRWKRPVRGSEAAAFDVVAQIDAARARLEVRGVERVGVDVAVPADDVERVAVQHVGLQAVADAQRDRPLA